MDKQLVFIASGGRTGTQFLGDLLSTVIDDCWSEHEADMIAGWSKLTLQRVNSFGLWHMFFGRMLGLTGVRATGVRFVNGKWSIEKCAKKLRAERRKYYEQTPQSLVIESYGRWWVFAGYVDKIWPGSKTVTVIRDPRSWIASWLHHHQAHAKKPLTAYFPPGPVTPKTTGDDEWSDRWETLSPVGRLAWEWRNINGRLHEAAEKSPLNKMFRYEDLFSPDAKSMQELIHFVAHHKDRQFSFRALENFANDRRNASTAKKGEWENWSDEDKALVDELCGPLMQEYGYAPLLTDKTGKGQKANETSKAA